MSVKLVILGMLKQGPQYGYELKHRIEEEMGDWTSIAFGSIYFALKKLTEEKCIRQAGHEQPGSRPSRIIYEITEEGESRFFELLNETWESEQRQFFPLDIGLFFSTYLEKNRRLEIINGKIKKIEYALKYINAHKEEELEKPEVPEEAGVIFSHSIYHLNAEYSWLKELAEKIKTEVK